MLLAVDKQGNEYKVKVDDRGKFTYYTVFIDEEKKLTYGAKAFREKYQLKEVDNAN